MYVNSVNSSMQPVSMTGKEKDSHKKIGKALLYSFPVAVGLSVAAETAKGARKAAFAKSSIACGAFLAGIGIYSKLHYAIFKNNDKYKNSVRQHPFLHLMADLGLALISGSLFSKGVKVLGNKLAENEKAIELFGKVKDKVKDFASKEKVAKVLNGIKTKVANAPSWVKSMGKGVAKYAPMMLMVAMLANIFDNAVRPKNVNVEEA